MRDPHTKDSRGFAFVTMENTEDAENAVTNLNATELMGRTMNVEKARRGRARTRMFKEPSSFVSRLETDFFDSVFPPFSHSWTVPRSSQALSV